MSWIWLFLAIFHNFVWNFVIVGDIAIVLVGEIAKFFFSKEYLLYNSNFFIINFIKYGIKIANGKFDDRLTKLWCILQHCCQIVARFVHPYHCKIQPFGEKFCYFSAFSYLCDKISHWDRKEVLSALFPL